MPKQDNNTGNIDKEIEKEAGEIEKSLIFIIFHEPH